MLFSCYAYIDSRSIKANRLRSYRARAKAKKLGLWNGLRGEENITRVECAIIAKRLGIAESSEIWNQKDGLKYATREEAQTMLERGSGKKSKVIFDPKTKAHLITRGEVAEIALSLKV